MNSFDVLIIGAGGAGLMCSIECGKRGRKVALLDHSKKIGQKILISGGGRCNFTNIHATAANYVSQNPHFAKSALSRYSPADFVKLVERHRIPFYEKKLGQLFCKDSAQRILTMLLDESKSAGCHIIAGNTIRSVEKSDDVFIVRTDNGPLSCQSLVVATGGLSIPQIGATGFGYDLARQFGLSIVETAPALDGFLFGKSELQRFSRLSGVSVETIVKVADATFRENVLFTHVGLSGPASLQASLYWRKALPLSIDWLPNDTEEALLSTIRKSFQKQEFASFLNQKLPRSLVEVICEELAVVKKVSSGLADKSILEILQGVKNWQFEPVGTVGYRKAEVTRGGVNTKDLSSQTMESRKVKGLYFVGEVVDVTGQLGGYNFQWAWASGHAAGQVA